MTGVAEAVVSQLVSAGVRRACTVPGESFLPLLDACERNPGIQLVSTRHESGAAFMAEADAKLSGGPALAMATRAVGAANLAIGVHTAFQDSTPMVVLLGQVESRFLVRGLPGGRPAGLLPGDHEVVGDGDLDTAAARARQAGPARGDLGPARSGHGGRALRPTRRNRR